MHQIGRTIDRHSHEADASIRSSSREDATPFPKAPVRVALLIDDFVQPAWAARAISELLKSPAINVALVVLEDRPPSPRQRFGSVRNWIRNRHFLAYSLYEAFDRRRFGTNSDPFADVDLT